MVSAVPCGCNELPKDFYLMEKIAVIGNATHKILIV